MRTKSLFTATVLAIAGAGVVTSADAANTYNDGDILIGFRATASGSQGANQTYVVNLGPASLFRDAVEGSSFTLTSRIGNIGADLASIYGADWHARADMFWGVAGALQSALGIDPANTLYATKEQSPNGALATTGYARRTSNQQSGTISLIQSAVLGYVNDDAVTANSQWGVIQNTSDPNNWTQFQPGGTSSGGISFQAFSPSIEGNDPFGIDAAPLDLFRMIRTTASDTGNGTYEGTFSIGVDGTLTFSVVPEPSTAALVAASGALIGFSRRRRRAVLA